MCRTFGIRRADLRALRLLFEGHNLQSMQSSLVTQTHLQHSGKPCQVLQNTLHRQPAAPNAVWCRCQKTAARRQRRSCMTLAAQQPVQLSEDEAAARQQFLDHSSQSGAPEEQQAIDLLTRAAKERKAWARR